MRLSKHTSGYNSRYLLLLVPLLLLVGQLFRTQFATSSVPESDTVETGTGSSLTNQQQGAIDGESISNTSIEKFEEIHLTAIRSPIEPEAEEDEEEEQESSTPPPPFPRPFRSQPPIRPFNEFQEDPLESVLEELKGCDRLSCIIRVHGKLDGRTTFNFPHFFLLGYPYAGVQQIIKHLNQHSEFDGSIAARGSSWFNACQTEKGPDVEAEGCNVGSEKEYVQKVLKASEAADKSLEMITVDASTDYVLAGGPLARRLYRYFPWLKVVIVIRDPITRILSKITRRLENGTIVYDCDPKRKILGCIQEYMAPGLIDSNYSQPLEDWLITFPKEQIHVVQYEELLEAPDKVMFDLKYFIGANVAELVGKFSLKGVDMVETDFRRGQYMKLLRLIESDVERTLSLLHHHGLIGKKSWLSRWEAGWEKVLANCNDVDICKVEAEVQPPPVLHYN